MIAAAVGIRISGSEANPFTFTNKSTSYLILMALSIHTEILSYPEYGWRLAKTNRVTSINPPLNHGHQPVPLSVGLWVCGDQDSASISSSSPRGGMIRSRSFPLKS